MTETYPAYKAYRIKTRLDEDADDFVIYSAPSAGQAKRMAVMGMRDSHPDANFPWITSCRRAPEYDELAKKLNGCICWRAGREWWHLEQGHWWDWEKPFPADLIQLSQ